jgi:AAA+ superfamily predicted ATPase
MLQQYFQYLRKVTEGRLNENLVPGTPFMPDTLSFPAETGGSPFQDFIEKHHLNIQEIIVLLIALAPHVDPVLFDELIQASIPAQGDFPQFGGQRGKNHRGFLPTGETVLFILAGNDLEKRFECEQIFSEDHLFSKLKILCLETPLPGEPKYSGKVILTPEYIERFTTGKISRPRMTMDFPAQYITTEMDWDDIVLGEPVMKQIRELEMWVKHHETMMKEWGMQKKLKPGYRALFHGPSGTGKTLTAMLLGKSTGLDVYKIDLSMVVSKFIGETEKNLANLFDRAENKNWILFFDEADALFSKRTNVRDAHDKYANQEAAYLLQRIETFNGLIILATNFKSNMDEAFIRRFHAVIHFPAPGYTERLAIWQKSLPASATISPDADLETIARKYDLTGAAILSVVQYCCLRAISGNSSLIDEAMLLEGIKREYDKAGKIW